VGMFADPLFFLALRAMFFHEIRGKKMFKMH